MHWSRHGYIKGLERLKGAVCCQWHIYRKSHTVSRMVTWLITNAMCRYSDVSGLCDLPRWLAPHVRSSYMRWRFGRLRHRWLWDALGVHPRHHRVLRHSDAGHHGVLSRLQPAETLEEQGCGQTRQKTRYARLILSGVRGKIKNTHCWGAVRPKMSNVGLIAIIKLLGLHCVSEKTSPFLYLW